MAWMIREDQLDPDQRDFINNESKKSGNIWVKGFAGSGKSVLLIHSLKDILKKEPNARVAIVVYTHSLIDMFKTGIKELNLSSSIPVMTYYEFVDKNNSTYDYILCDEVQDLPAKVLFAMNNRAKKVIVAGDSNQSIYDDDPKWREKVVNADQVGDIINARAFSLNMIHRLTRSIITAVQKLLPRMNIWGAKRDTTKVDVNIRLCEATSEREEVKYVYQESQKGTSVGDTCVVLLPTHNAILNFSKQLLLSQNKPEWKFTPISWDIDKPVEKQRPDYDSLNRYFRSVGVRVQYVGNNHGSLKDAEDNKDTILMTYHSSKGLDFDNVFLPFLNNSLFISPRKQETLFMVALTRSRKNLYLSYYGYTHDLVEKFKDDCTEIKISDLNTSRSTTKPSNSFDF
jgi:superfamily I DNA/RNA helicase